MQMPNNTEGKLGKYNFAESFERLKTALDCCTITALAMCLGLAQSGISRVWMRGTVLPMEWLARAVIINGTNPMWVLYGEPYRKKMVPADECEPQIDSFEEFLSDLQEAKSKKPSWCNNNVEV